MIRHGNRIQVQYENGEQDVIVLMALAMAGFQKAPRGLDHDDVFVADDMLTAEDVADFIDYTPRGIELRMIGDVRGRDCSIIVAPVLGIKGALEVDRERFEGDVVDLILHAEEILADLVPQNGFSGKDILQAALS